MNRTEFRFAAEKDAALILDFIKALAEYTAKMHERGLIDKDFTANNILYSCDGENYRFALVDINIPPKISGLSYNIFASCENLKTVVIPEGVTSIITNAFSCCYSLERIDIPKTINYIGGSAFEQCTNLKKINYGGTTSQWEELTKFSDWAEGTQSLSIICSNGTIKYGD